ncbi:MAG: flagellar biosynthetic protein FlhB [Nitrospinaceae bacterium]|nr:MAG: flagellar biosynthetic protein FlhB [Nitrospinaceae bacterium]
MAEENKDQKTEEASSKRIADSEEKGNFALSKEMTSSFILLAAVLSLYAVGQQGPLKMMALWRGLLSEAHVFRLTTEELFNALVLVMKSTFFILSPILFTIMIAGIISNLIQTRGLKFSTHPLIPKFNKLNPLKGFGRIFSKNSLMELFKSLFKITIVSIISYQTIKSHWDEIPPLVHFDVGQTLVFMGQVSLEIMIKVLLVMIFLALIDYLFQRFTYLENLRMTKQEVKDERKETDGNPQVKQRIRTVQMEMTRRRMMSAVPEADVVVTNPTHLAIAIKYDIDKYAAPILVAKGAGAIAQKIRTIAEENDVPIVEDKPLAQVLHRTVEVGQLIPASLYKAVAEILAYVYRLKGKNAP